MQQVWYFARSKKATWTRTFKQYFPGLWLSFFCVISCQNLLPMHFNGTVPMAGGLVAERSKLETAARKQALAQNIWRAKTSCLPLNICRGIPTYRTAHEKSNTYSCLYFISVCVFNPRLRRRCSLHRGGLCCSRRQTSRNTQLHTNDWHSLHHNHYLNVPAVFLRS